MYILIDKKKKKKNKIYIYEREQKKNKEQRWKTLKNEHQFDNQTKKHLFIYV